MTGPRLSRINRRPEEQRETQKYDDTKNEKNVLKIHQLKKNNINLTLFSVGYLVMVKKPIGVGRPKVLGPH